MGDPSGVNKDYGDDKPISVAKIVQSMEEKLKGLFHNVPMTNDKKTSAQKGKCVITDHLGKYNYLSLIKKSQSDSCSGNVIPQGNESLVEAGPSIDRHHQIANVPRIGISTSIDEVNMESEFEYHASGIGCTESQVVSYSDGHSIIHKGHNETLRNTDYEHDQQKTISQYKLKKNNSNENIHKSQEFKYANWKYKSHFVENPGSVEIEVDPSSTNDPDEYWENFMKDQVGPITEIIPLSSQSEIGHNCIRFVCMSDTHNRINEFNIQDFLAHVPAGDVLLHTGDFTLHGDGIHGYKDFNDFLSLLPHRIKLVIPGNHEVSLDPRYSSSCDIRLNFGMSETSTTDDSTENIEYLKSVISNAKVLIDNLVEFCGIKIYGLPWVPEYGVFGFGLPRGYALLKKYDQIPAGIDILMSHGPALGFCDVSHRGLHVGCAELLNSVRLRIKPKYVVHGHIHEAHGIQSDGTTTFINATICDRRYKLSHDPVIFDYPLPHPFTKDDFMKLNLDDLQLL